MILSADGKQEDAVRLASYTRTPIGTHETASASTTGEQPDYPPIQDPFIPADSELRPPNRLLRVVKSGERVPVTLLFTQKRVDVGLRLAVPPLGSKTTHLYGIEYDDASRGKHEGVYEGKKLFELRQKDKGAGAFLLHPRDLRRGYTFAEALADRYDVDIPGSSRVKRAESEQDNGKKGIALGSSGIIVEAPGLEDVRKRMAQLQRLQSVGLEGYDVCGTGGDDETKSFLRTNLTSLTTLNLSNNLFTLWSDVAEIVACVPTLRKIMLNNSRILRLTLYPHDLKTGDSIREAFQSIREMELCDSCMSWNDVLAIAPFMPHLERLDLVDNTTLTNLDPMRTINGVPVLLELRYLNLAGCGITDWEDLMRSIGSLRNLETLDMSHTPPRDIVPPPSSQSPVGLHNLILLSSNITSWTSIDSLQQWTGETLTSLKFTISQTPLDRTYDPALRVSGDQAADRLILIAKLPGLTMLNSSPVSASERRDAEISYIKMVNGLVESGKGKIADWGRYEELKKAHGFDEVGQGVPNLKLNHLRSRLYVLSVFIANPEGVLEHSTDLSVLPSSPMALLRKKIHRTLQGSALQDVKIWTVSEKFVEGERGKAVEVPDGETVGWWFADGDEIIAEA